MPVIDRSEGRGTRKVGTHTIAEFVGGVPAELRVPEKAQGRGLPVAAPGHGRSARAAREGCGTR